MFLMAENGNGLRKYMALWIFLVVQAGGGIWWMATLTNQIASMQRVGGVPISTEARERLTRLETQVAELQRQRDFERK